MTNSHIHNANTALTFCATLADEWARAGVTKAFIAPGSRSTPLILALDNNEHIEIEVFVDERSASFAALGFGLATNTPALAVCTSGTAATHFHAAVVEASQSGVPLIVCTADRPIELQQVGAPQAINQNMLYGNSVRYFADPGEPSEAWRTSWRSFASRAALEAYGLPHPGPVHLNLRFREPFLGEFEALPQARDDKAAWHSSGKTQTTVSTTQIAAVAELAVNQRGLIIAGNGVSDPAAVIALSDKLNWPIVADHRSKCRTANSIDRFDFLLRFKEFANNHMPETIIRFGEPLASKALTQFLKSANAKVVAATNLVWNDSEHIANLVVPEVGLAQGLLNSCKNSDDQEWLQSWRKHNQQARDALTSDDSEEVLNGKQIAEQITQTIQPGSALVLSSSMPIRDVEWFGASRTDIDVYSNRGANGIDGVIATAVGVAASNKPTFVLIGDVAFLHDSSTLVSLAERKVDLTIIVVDNNGGNIFNQLPQAEVLDLDTFNKLFITPHSADLLKLCQAHKLPAVTWDKDSSFEKSLSEIGNILGTKVVVAQSQQSEGPYSESALRNFSNYT